MMQSFENTGLWKASLGKDCQSPLEKQKVELLRAAYFSFWDNATLLSREIQRDLPNLTLHDDAHFNALWRTADLIAGPLLELNPLEAFVFGGAILLHDNANSIAAFSGGIAALKATPEWQDAEAIAKEKNVGLESDGNTSVVATGADTESEVLFDVLRTIHAERARQLAGLTFRKDGKTVHLIEADDLRNHLGDII